MNDQPLTISIFGMDYWPDATGIAPYTTGIAEHLQGRGNHVSVKAGMPYYPQWEIAREYRRSVRRTDSHNGVTIDRRRQYVPASQSALKRLGFEGSFFVNAALSRIPQRPDVVVGVIPALADGVLALATARRYRVPMVLIVQDLMGSAAEQSGMRGGARVAAATGRLESWICRQAAEIGVVATGFRDRLVSGGVPEDRIHLTRNWTHIGEPSVDRDTIRAQFDLPRDRFIALHAGNMGLKQGLDHLIDAARVAQTAAPDLLFVLMGDGNQRDHLQRLAADLINVRFLPPQDEHLFPSILAASDALLVNQLASVTDMSLPSKLTSYFSVGRPVVASVAAGSETAKVVTESGGGVVVDPTNAAEYVAALCQLAGDPDRSARLGCHGQDYAHQHLSAEAALSRLEALIHRALRTGAPHSTERTFA